MVVARTPEQLQLIRKSGVITAKALKKVLDNAKPGVSLVELDRIAEEEIRRLGGEPSFMTVEGYSWATCLTINNEVVHGIPRPIQLHEGDIFSIDMGAVFKGWHTDSAWTIIVGGGTNQLLETGEKAMWNGIKKAVTGHRVGDISSAMQTTLEDKGYSVVRSLVGHGVGQHLHEEPEIPGYGVPNTGPKLIKNMTIAIEAIYAEGSGEVETSSDGWTIVTKDSSMHGFFEMSVIVGDKKPEVLTDWRGM